MTFIAAFDAGLTGLVYDLRLPIAVVSLFLLVVATVVAYRLGWFAAARRHPARATAMAVVVLAVALPIGFYTISPLFIRSTLIEDAPVAVADVSPSPSSASSGSPGEAPTTTPGVAPATTASPPLSPAPPLSATPPPTPTQGPIATPRSTPTPRPIATPRPTPRSTPTPPPTPTPFAPSTVASGEFSGTDDFHYGSGTASIIETAPGLYTLRLKDFSVRNGPDLFVYLSQDPDGYVDGALEVGRLKATDGSFNYALPAGTDPSDFASALIWCKQFSHLFAVAPF